MIDMEISDNCLNLVKKFEGFSPTPYICPAGKLTVGFGHVVKANEHFDIITEDHALHLLAKDLEWAQSSVCQCVNVDITQNQYDALVSFAFNVGGGAFLKSTLLRKLNDGEDCAEEFLRWVYGGSQKLPGLVARREAERALFLKA